MPDTFEPQELFKFENVALDVARAFGNESSQGIDRAYRAINRAGIFIAGFNRRWSWQFVTDSFQTTDDQSDYSLAQDLKTILQMRIEGSYRRILKGIPKRKFRELVPDADVSSGTPAVYFQKGVDSSGAKVFFLWPIPDSNHEIHYDYFRNITPLRNSGDDIRAKWGIPESMVNVLIQTAKAFMYEGSDMARHKEELALANEWILEAYAADQENLDTDIRAPQGDPDFELNDGPVFPPNVG